MNNVKLFGWFSMKRNFYSDHEPRRPCATTLSVACVAQEESIKNVCTQENTFLHDGSHAPLVKTAGELSCRVHLLRGKQHSDTVRSQHFACITSLFFFKAPVMNGYVYPLNFSRQQGFISQAESISPCSHVRVSLLRSHWIYVTSVICNFRQWFYLAL